ncbi:MAG: HupE/UreJ family protein [Rhodothermales bacterium]|nr:HupE/UreJ family protein [Rhodothermales bacterium]
MKQILTVLGLMLLLWVPDALAKKHDRGQSYVYFRIHGDSVVVRVEITAEHLNEALGLDLATGDGVPVDSVLAHAGRNLDAIRAFIAEQLTLRIPGGAVLSTDFRDVAVLRVPRFGDFLQLTYDVGGFEDLPDRFEVTYTAMFDVDNQHRNMVLVEHDWRSTTFNNESNVAFTLKPSEPTGILDLTGSTVMSGFAGMIGFGIEHILIGFDHILFLLALILPSVLYWEDRTWKPETRFRTAFINIVKIVTFFTLAHTITLSLAAMKVIVLPSILVESIIAASIAVAALHNLSPRFFRYEWLIAFVFGLFHGFGFAGLLEPLGLGREYTLLTLLGFNLGVEIGQVIIIAAVFPLLYMIRKWSMYRPLVLRAGSVALIAIAMFWFVERAFAPQILVDAKEVMKDIARPVYHAVMGLVS